jgi:hypothetical protein
VIGIVVLVVIIVVVGVSRRHGVVHVVSSRFADPLMATLYRVTDVVNRQRGGRSAGRAASGQMCAAVISHSRLERLTLPDQYGGEGRGKMIGSVRIVFAGIMFGLAVVPAAADDPPMLNMGPTCDAAGAGAIAAGRDKQACMKEETEARDLLTKNWSQYRPGDRTQCVGMVSNGGPPSYVELISCLETMKGAAAISKTEPGDDTDPVTIGRQRRETNSAPRGLYYDAGVSQPAARPARR